jgi:transposase
MARQNRQTGIWEGLSVVHPHAAGLDIGSEEIWVAVPPTSTGEAVRCFGTYTPDLMALAAWLRACGVDTVAMESTGVYWIPVYEILEGQGIQPYVVNARHIKNVPGRKSDIQDCQWIQGLHSVGLLSASFRPAGEICTLRAYLRQRATLIEHRAAHIQHMQKALQQMNVQLTQVVGDISGQTGLAIIRAILAGERDPETLAALRHARCQQAGEQFVKALTGNYRAEHVFALKQAVALYDVYTEQLRECDGEIERQFANLKPLAGDPLPPLPPNSKPNSRSKNGPAYDARSLLYRITGVDLCAIPGLNVLTVQQIITEVGTDASRWPSVKHFCSWLRLAPHNDISGGKVLKSRVLKGANRAGLAFRLAAQAVARETHSAFGAYYRRMRARKGPQQAIVATAHRIARTFYYMLKTRTPYDGMAAEEYTRQAQEREIVWLKKAAAKHGLTLTAGSASASGPAYEPITT